MPSLLSCLGHASARTQDAQGHDEGGAGEGGGSNEGQGSPTEAGAGGGLRGNGVMGLLDLIQKRAG